MLFDKSSHLINAQDTLQKLYQDKLESVYLLLDFCNLNSTMQDLPWICPEFFQTELFQHNLQIWIEAELVLH